MKVTAIKHNDNWISYSQSYPIPGRKVRVETLLGFFVEIAKKPKETKVHEEMRLKWKYVK